MRLRFLFLGYDGHPLEAKELNAIIYYSSMGFAKNGVPYAKKPWGAFVYEESFHRTAGSSMGPSVTIEKPGTFGRKKRCLVQSTPNRHCRYTWCIDAVPDAFGVLADA